MRAAAFVLGLLCVASVGYGDSPEDLEKLLRTTLIDPAAPWREVQEFCESRVPRVPEAASAEEWTRIADDLRTRAIRDVVLRGEAAEWARQPTRVEWQGEIEGGPEYRIRKLRYEAVPGMWIPALLYEPKRLEGKVPAVMNVNGHDGTGKAADYKQIRCINQAKRGMLALNVEWVGMGQLRGEDFVHYRMNQLDLLGTSGLAPFYLSLKRGLDVLLQHEHADPERVAVAGLSGGGWQTIFISGLDERVTLSNPVAGYSSFRTRARVTKDLGDSEQTPSDLATVVDYTHLTAMRAPRPTLLTNNDRDQCCFAAGDALPLLLQAARPVYRLFDGSDNLWVHINHVPGTHNFEQDNREALYRMFAAHFYPDADFNTSELDCSDELKSAEQLAVDLPEGNAGFNTLARQLMEGLPDSSETADVAQARTKLEELVRCRPLEVANVEERPLGEWGSAKATGLTIRLGEEWTIPATRVSPPEPQRTAIVICDGGRAAATHQIAELIAGGAEVVAVDPFYFGESKITQRDFLYGLLVAAVGERPLGIQVAQLRAVSRHFAARGRPVELHAIGRRTGLGALIAGALEPEAVVSLQIHGGFDSLRQIIEENLKVSDAPELFCFGLLKEFDIPQIERLVAPRAVQKFALRSEPQAP